MPNHCVIIISLILFSVIINELESSREIFRRWKRNVPAYEDETTVVTESSIFNSRDPNGITIFEEASEEVIKRNAKRSEPEILLILRKISRMLIDMNNQRIVANS